MKQAFSLAHAQSANGKPIEGERKHRFSTPSSKIFVGSSLNDAKDQLIAAPVNLQATLGPANRPLCGSLHIRARRIVRYAFIQDHCDIASEELLDLHRPFRCKPVMGAVQVRLKTD